MRKVAVLTGSRGEYSIYASVLDAIDERADLSYELIVTGMHLEKKFGYTIEEIRKDNRKIGAEVPMLKYEDTLAGMVKNTGEAIIGITESFERIKPDLILVLGDRGEQLAAAMAGAHLNIPVAHLHGGEVSGTIDESIRHAITKFAHIHLPATKLSRDRIIKLGEREENIFLVGAPGVDAVKKRGKTTRQEIAKHFNFDPNKAIILAIQHPVTTEFNERDKNTQLFIEAILELGEQTVCIYPNSDAGHTGMMELLKKNIKYSGKQNKIKLYESLPHEIFISLMKQAAIMIGNSSSGIIEAPSCNTPYVLVGTRQTGREKAESILEVPYNKVAILNAAFKALNDKEFRAKIMAGERPYDPFRDDNAGKRTADVLATCRINSDLLQKRITY